MSSEWVQQQLSNLVTIKGGKRLPAGKSLQQEPNSHPYIRVRDVGQRDLPRTGLEFVPDELFPPISRYIVQPNDVVLSIVGTIGALSIVDVHYNLASLTENCVKLHGLDHEDALYLFYYLSSPVGQQEIHRGTVGAVQPKLPIYNIEKIAVVWPDRSNRVAIAGVLGALDDRIALLRETNATLEAIAQALFKSWFVDFDPVHAKQQGRAPEGMDEAATALFPDSFEESELGLVPKGWRVSTVGQEVTTVDYVANGSFASLKESVTLRFEPNFALYVRTTDYNSDFKGDFRYVDQSGYDFLSKSSLTGSDVIISNVGDVGTVFRPPTWLGLPMTLGSNAVALKNPEISGYMFYFFKGDRGQNLIQSIVTGSAQLKFNKTSLRALPFLLPSSQVLLKFEKIAGSLLKRIDENKGQAQTLATLRDTLLPRLISGQLRLPDAEALIEEAA